ncbi:MAG: hypothetical protein ACE5MG_09425 [Candidatus Methylomirabilales bacterium]
MKRDLLLMACQSSRQLIFWLASLAVVGVGCTKTHLNDVRYFPTGLAPKDAISVILENSPGEENAVSTEELEAKVAECIRDELEDTHPTLPMVTPDELRRVALSDLPPEDTRPSDWSWEDPLFQERIAPLGLRYLIRVTVSEWKDKPTFFPFIWAQKRFATMHAVVLDLMHGRTAGTVNVAADNSTAAGIVVAGGGGYGVAFPWVQFPSAPVKHACSKLGEGVAKVLAGESPITATGNGLGSAGEKVEEAKVEEWVTPTEVRDWLARADSSMKKGDYDAAIKEYQAALDLDAGDRTAQGGLSRARSAKQVTPTPADWLLGEWVGIRESQWWREDVTLRITSYDQATHTFKGDGMLYLDPNSNSRGPSTDLVIEAVVDDEGRVVMTIHGDGGSSASFHLKREHEGTLSGTTRYGLPRLSLEKEH